MSNTATISNSAAFADDIFGTAVANVRSLILKAIDKDSKATLSKGSAMQQIACAVITYYGALVDHGDKPAAWSELAEKSGAASTKFRDDFLADVLNIPKKPKARDGEELTEKSKMDHATKRRNAFNRLSDGTALAASMVALGLDAGLLNPNTGLITVPVSAVVPEGMVLDINTHGDKLTHVPLDGKPLKAGKRDDEGKMTGMVTIYADAKHVNSRAAGIFTARKTRGANTKTDATKADDSVANALKGKTTAEIAEGLTRAAKDVVLANADFATVLRAAAKHLTDLRREDAAPITKQTFSRDTLRAFADLAEYYNSVVSPALAAAA